MDRTGRAPGTVSPVIYLESPSGYLRLVPIERGHDESLARRIWKEKYPDCEWREASRFEDIKRLEQRLVEQEKRSQDFAREQQMLRYDAVKRRIRSNIWHQLQQEHDPWKKEFLRNWLHLDDEKRKQFEQRWAERDSYLWAMHMDSGTKVDDRMKGPNSL